MKSCMGKLYLELDYANNSPLCIAERDTKDFPQSLQQNFWIPSLRLPFRTTFSLPHMGHTLPLLKRCSSI